MACEEDREEILSLYKAQIGREYCPWSEEYPSNETIDFDLSRDALFVLKEDGKIKASISIDGGISISFTPCLPNRRYTLYGAPSLTGPWAWTDNFDDSDFISTNQFFKVGVELP